jgi:beta-N-acetylhexosaminidase
MLPAIFGLSGLEMTAEEAALFRACDPAGFILFGRNVGTRAQMRALTDSLRDLLGRDNLLILIDQEGGRVQRMKPPEWPAFPAGAAFDALYDTAPITAIEAARTNAAAIAHNLAEVGITADALPLLDVRQAGAHDVIGDRAYGHEPMRVAAMGRAVLEGLASGGVAGIVKHMPGHGRSMCDTHKDLPRVTDDVAALESDLAPFRALNQAGMAMTAHIIYEAWDADRPATLSPYVIEHIMRGEIGFDGLIMTDDIDMQALSGPVPARAEAAIAAGCDVVLNCWAKMDDMAAMADRLPPMTDTSLERLGRAMAGFGPIAPEGTAFDNLIAKRDALLAQVA